MFAGVFAGGGADADVAGSGAVEMVFALVMGADDIDEVGDAWLSTGDEGAVPQALMLASANAPRIVPRTMRALSMNERRLKRGTEDKRFKEDSGENEARRRHARPSSSRPLRL